MPERHQKGFTLAGITFTFPRSFHKKVKDSCDSVGRLEALNSESVLASLAFQERTHESSRMKKFLQEMVVFQDVCMVCYLFNKGKHSREREHPLWTYLLFLPL